jgi:hypothetical protein
VEEKTMRGEHGLQKGKGAGAVTAEVNFRLLHAFACLDEGGKVHHTVKRTGSKGVLEECAVGEVALDESCSGGEHGAVAVAEVVINDNGVPGAEQVFSHGAADIAGAACHENFQRSSSFPS